VSLFTLIKLVPCGKFARVETAFSEEILRRPLAAQMEVLLKLETSSTPLLNITNRSLSIRQHKKIKSERIAHFTIPTHRYAATMIKLKFLVRLIRAQVMLLDANFIQIDTVFGLDCPVCAVNLKRMWCEYTCNPNKARFGKYNEK
jgi:hypothetical protein